ncbi:type III-B CRISPR module RAMP protein Cmr6 [Thiohalobacter sp. IOR34]|uniref:type III-B CRISPR module RAMP protein Cmr6 n=1 Tax=Thiohalobacter sp. IOR34 TaxID=3057176 RepID=UPI0025AED8E9|nr:type III-B CRISPR module RAMP protein Cmr6 [Thiohalobacter sp. IOR34]WJW76672.1 type III-B CRISPR module RAMP protein Cmr6 [Thiohalobacter sp. IOR34]
MPIAAVPGYLGQNFETASPGMRFGMYFRGWNHRFAFEKDRKHEAVETACALSVQDKKALNAIRKRQDTLHAALPDERKYLLDARSTAPFATGLGNEHPLENGFAFLWPYGLPYLPGSGVKGVLRQAARELADGNWGETKGWTEAAIEILFGPEDSNDARRGALSFWDVIPQIRGNALQVEVMTPHQSHYYRGDAAPHDSGQPVPIFFLTVPPGSGFTFHVIANPALAGELAGSWRELLQAAFEHAFDWLGFGAKTAVGYGAMRIDEDAEEQRREHMVAAQEKARLEAMSEEERLIDAVRQQLEADRAANRREPGGPLNEQRLHLLEQALEWQDGHWRCQAAQLLRETARHLPWSKKRKKAINEQLARLEEACP